jgi:hypothetical protein
MHHKVIRGSPAILCALLLFCLGCSPVGSAGPITYNRIVIDTYDPLGAGADAINPTIVQLWNAAGTKLAEDDGGLPGSSRPILTPALVSWPGQGYGYIDYTGGLLSGDYFILVKESLSGTDAFGYGIRILTQPSILYGPDWVVSTPVESASDSSLIGGGTPRADQLMTLNVLPTHAPPNAKLGRWIVASGENWIKITLP